MNDLKHFYEDEGLNKFNYNNYEDYDNNFPSRAISQKRENNQPSLLRRYIIYILMFLLIIAAIILNNYDVGEFLKNHLDIDSYKYDYFKKNDLAANSTISNNSNQNPKSKDGNDFIMEFKKNYIYPNYSVLVVIFLSVLIFILFYLANHLKKEQNISIKNELELEDQIKSDPYLIRQSNYQFEQLRNYYTRRELEKLCNSDQFRQMTQEKGKDLTNWNWQLKEKAMKDVYRENGTESEDISHLSLSD